MVWHHEILNEKVMAAVRIKLAAVEGGGEVSAGGSHT
jgi:hypothetical protein